MRPTRITLRAGPISKSFGDRDSGAPGWLRLLVFAAACTALLFLATGAELWHQDAPGTVCSFTVINLTNKVALYNFLSTFSGTHFVTPRTYTAELGYHF